MICTVSTVKDARVNVERFVEQNLTAGVDHMFVFLEHDPDGQLEALQQHAAVTPVLADESLWGPDRPDLLMRRQMVNANTVNCVLATVPGVDWLVHLDCDECIDIDLDRLAALSEDVRCIRLRVLEAVNTENGSHAVQLFKRKLAERKLAELLESGLVSEADNRSYLSGHTIGKAAVRPALDLLLGVHRVKDRAGRLQPHLKDDAFSVLHYDCVSADDFIAKWTARASSEPLSLAMRPSRRAIYEGFVKILALGLPASEERGRFEELYRATGEDPVAELDARGLLVTPQHAVRATPRKTFTAGQLADIDLLLSRLVAGDRRFLYPLAGLAAVLDRMTEVGRSLEVEAPRLAEQVTLAVARARTGV